MKMICRCSGEVQELRNKLHLPDEVVLEQFAFKDGNRELSREEAARFLEFIRKELEKQ
ncbi:hypothetical protein [Paenibacillus mesotrionivorans]|jgi:hypothetical protein|uniref:Uncharacterized protein n=1 Tax=Paenibacillus mesotrionivorans TaxID=3160968 RepID=A0ACC7NSC6_9BACL